MRLETEGGDREGTDLVGDRLTAGLGPAGTLCSLIIEKSRWSRPLGIERRASKG